MCRSNRLVTVIIAWAAGFLAATANAQQGYRQEVTVSEPTRLDWTFALSNQSVVDPPADWLADYDSSRQRYELFAPPTPKGKSDGLPVVLFISAGDTPAGWNQFESICKQKNILFASPYGAGNNTATPRRVRIILDVLDDIRRQHRIDPDRTYIAGFSGGGRVACAIAFALPELFGGIMPVCAGGELREEPWLRHRAIDRLSIAFMTGSDDFNLGEIERFRRPMFSDLGIRTRTTVVPMHGHAIPAAKSLQSALDWLDAGAAERRKLAQRRPATRIKCDQSTSREDLAKAQLSDGEQLLKDRKTQFRGLMLLQGTMARWPDLSQADRAKQILLEYEGQKEKPWEADDIAEQRKFLIARTRALDAYATGPLPDQYSKQRSEMLKAALEGWKAILDDGQDAKAAAEATRRVPVIEKMLQ